MRRKAIGVLIAIVVISAGKAFAVDLQPTRFESERQKIRYEFAALEAGFAADEDEFNDFGGSQAAPEENKLKLKSPAKAFFLSLAVPGLGQYYYGSRIKPVVFLGAEAATWVLHIKWHGEGEDLTDEFETFNRTHWSRSDYEDKYLMWTYGYDDDDDVPPEYREINHSLPETETQQYFEMTGKYNQFAWGWDDAVMDDGRTLDSFSVSNPPPRVFWNDSVPYSANRDTYERMRQSANDKFDDANKMIMVAIANRLISAFEAYFVTRHQNGQIEKSQSVFSRVDVRARLRSYYTRRDTPFMQVSYRF